MNNIFILSLTLSVGLFASTPAFAQSLQLGPNYVPNYAQQVMPGNPGPLQPPPIGDGPNAPQEIQGQAGNSPNVPTGTAQTTPETPFPTQTPADRSIVRLYIDEGGRGTRQVQTLRGDTLTADQLSQIEGILGVNMESGEQQIPVTITTAQMAQINQVLAPYPNTVAGPNGTKQIVADSPAPGYPKPGETSLYGYTPDHPLPTVWTFGRYLVILGVVCSTIFMAMAAVSMVLGNPYGGKRVIGAAGGLMLLLCAYTIWKIVQMDTFDGNSTTVNNIQQPTTDQVSAGNVTTPDLPVDPGMGAARQNPQRSGIPVVPLGNAINPN